MEFSFNNENIVLSKMLFARYVKFSESFQDVKSSSRKLDGNSGAETTLANM